MNGADASARFRPPSIATILANVAAALGDSLNYFIGSRVGAAVYARDSRWIRRDHLDQARAFFERHGGKAIVIARFAPFLRTFVPFVAGVVSMTYSRFLAYNVIGGFIWIYFFTYAGYLFGNQPFVQKNFKLVILAIIIISVVPIVVEFVKEWRKHRKTA